MKIILLQTTLLLFAMNVLASCHNSDTIASPIGNTTTKDPAILPTTTEDGPTKTGTAKDPRFMVSAASFGLITLSDDFQKIVAKYNAENVQDGKLSIAQSENEFDVTYIFKGTPKEIIVYWTEHHKTISRIEAVQPNNPYRDEHGIGYGTTMQELETINGATISFNGFKWEMAGMITDFHNGKLQSNNEADHLIYNIDINNDNPPVALLGDVVLDTELNLVQDHMANIFVNQLILVNN